MIGANIKKYRKKKKMSQEELAQKIGYDRSSVAKWEIGALKPYAETLKAIANVLEVSIEQLYK